MGYAKKSFKLVWRYQQLLYGFLAKGHLPQSRLLANDKGDNEIRTEAVHRSPVIYFKDEKNHGKQKLVDRR